MGWMETFKYKGFISYSHADEKWGSWLHRKLETYQFPRRTVGRETKKGIVPKRFTPVFRDRDELSAGASLGAEIQQALRQSENLIVLCSPRSVQSYWVRKEIQYFKKHNNAQNIFAFIIDGVPFAKPDSEEQECFPDVLRFEVDEKGDLLDQVLEPLAANAKPDGDGKSLALLKLLSGMSGLGLDELVQRDLQRARRRLMTITGAAVTIMLAMGTLTWLAWDAREEAEKRRADAEGLIEFMLTDLRDKLEPVGKLDILDAVGQKAIDYYDVYDLDNLGADATGRRAASYHLLGEIQMRMGKISAAKTYFEPAFDFTEKELLADPENPDRIYEHIQSVYWRATPYLREQDYQSFLKNQELYLQMAQRLHDIEGASDRAIQEMAYGLGNVGLAWQELGEIEKSRDFYMQSLRFRQDVVERNPTVKAELELANNYNQIAGTYYAKDKAAAYDWELKRAEVVDDLYKSQPDNYQVLLKLIISLRTKGYYQTELGNWSAARRFLELSLEKIEHALSIEPRDDNVLKMQLNVHERLTTIAENTGDFELQVHHSEIYSDLLNRRLRARQPNDFDKTWDYEKPYQNIRFQMRAYFARGDFDGAKNLLPLYDSLLNRIEGRAGFENNVNSVKAHYLTFMSFLEDDLDAYRSLSGLLDEFGSEKGFNNFKPMHRLLSRKYCDETDPCWALQPSLGAEDLRLGTFPLFKQRHPDIAKAIEEEIQTKIELGKDNSRVD